MQITNFDATNIPPQQVAGKHPSGMFPATISGTKAEPTKAGDGGIFVVTFSTSVGSIDNRYNLWNKNEKAVEIAQKELSALCHATGIYKLSMSGDNLPQCGFELRGAVCVIEVQDQAANPQYSEVKKVFDKNGNEPGKPSAAPQPQQQVTQQLQPAQQQPQNNSGWSNGTQHPTAAQPQVQSGWGAQQQPQQQQPQGNGGTSPPWAR